MYVKLQASYDNLNFRDVTMLILLLSTSTSGKNASPTQIMIFNIYVAFCMFKMSYTCVPREVIQALSESGIFRIGLCIQPKGLEVQRVRGCSLIGECK